MADNDEAGQKAAERVRVVLAGKVKLVELTLPEGVDDPGNMTDEQAQDLIRPHIENMRNE